MNRIETQQGIIGFFDILGYQSFLKNNSTQDAAKIVLDAFRCVKRLQPKARKELKEACRMCANSVPRNTGESENDEQYIKGRIRETKHLIFADTILLRLPFKPHEDDNQKCFDVLLFYVQSAILWQQMMLHGMPIRGGMEIGEYYIKRVLFVGKVIVDAHEAGSMVDASAIVLLPGIRSFLEKANQWNPPAVLDFFFPEYPLRIKIKPQNSEMHLEVKKQRILNVFYFRKGDESFWSIPIAYWFGLHKKEMGPDAIRKAKNTQDLVSHLDDNVTI